MLIDHRNHESVVVKAHSLFFSDLIENVRRDRFDRLRLLCIIGSELVKTKRGTCTQRANIVRKTNETDDCYTAQDMELVEWIQSNGSWYLKLAQGSYPPIVGGVGSFTSRSDICIPEV